VRVCVRVSMCVCMIFVCMCVDRDTLATLNQSGEDKCESCACVCVCVYACIFVCMRVCVCVCGS